MLKLVNTKQPTTIYFRAATLLHKYPDADKNLMAVVLDCSIGMAATLRSYFNTCDGDPVKMQGKANEASRRSKAKVA